MSSQIFITSFFY